MNKKTHSISINILSAIVILLCLFLGAVNPVNAWFTDSHKNGVQIQIEIGDLKLKVFQNNASVAGNEISTNADNAENNTNKYIELSGEITPDNPVNLKLILTNKDSGSASMYVRYKFEVYTRGISADTKLDGVEIAGFVAPTESAKGVVKDGDYYYYRDNTNANALFTKGSEFTMLQTFKVPFSAFVDVNGNMLITNSATIYLKLIVEASISQTFAV